MSLCTLLPCCFFDHDFVNLYVNLASATPSGPGVWKFNNSLLSDSLFCCFISNCISDFSSCVS